MKTTLLALVHGEYLSHTIRALEISKALRKTGNYDITFSGSGSFMNIVESERFKCVETETLSNTKINNILANKFTPKMFTKKEAEKYYKIESELLKEHKPDIILRDYFRDLAGIGAKEQGIYDVYIQLASCSPYYNFNFRPSSFPKILNKIPECVTRPLRPLEQRGFRWLAFKPILNQVKKQKLQVNKNVSEGYEADLILLADEKRLFPFKDLRTNYKFIGPPLFFDNYPNPEWLDSFAKDPRKKVLITGGTTGEHEKTKLFINTFKNEEFAIALYANNNIFSNGFYGSNTFNICKVLPHVGVFVTHGGLGAMYAGLRQGVPILALPNQLEQEINSVQLEKTGAGLWLPPKKATPENIIKSLNIILEDPCFKEKAVNFSKSMIKDPLALAVKYIKEGYERFKNNN